MVDIMPVEEIKLMQLRETAKRFRSRYENSLRLKCTCGETMAFHLSQVLDVLVSFDKLCCSDFDRLFEVMQLEVVEIMSLPD